MVRSLRLMHCCPTAIWSLPRIQWKGYMCHGLVAQFALRPSFTRLLSVVDAALNGMPNVVVCKNRLGLVRTMRVADNCDSVFVAARGFPGWIRIIRPVNHLC